MKLTIDKKTYDETGVTGGTFSGTGFSKAELINVANLVFAAKNEIRGEVR